MSYIMLILRVNIKKRMYMVKLIGAKIEIDAMDQRG